MRRIGLAVVLIISVLLTPLAAEAQKASKVPQLGLLDYAAFWGEPFKHGLRDLGYQEGADIAFVYRPSDGKSERLRDLAAELVRLKVDVIVSYGTPATRAAKDATTTIPIVMLGIGDPVRTGLVSSLARPSGNVTGNTILGPEIGPKRLQLLREALPKLARIAFLRNPANASNVLAFQDAEAGARALGVTLLAVDVSGPDQLESALAAVARDHADALIMTADPMLLLNARRVVEFAARNRLPTMYQAKEIVITGGLMSYGPSLPHLFRLGAAYVDRLLKGAKPADLPVEQPTKFELVINLKTAKALGLTIPQSILVRADEIIR